MVYQPIVGPLLTLRVFGNDPVLIDCLYGSYYAKSKELE